MFWIPIAMAAMSLAKNAQDQQNQQRQTMVEAAKARYSPWTGMRPNEIQYAQPASNMMQALGGIMAYQQQQKRNDQLNQLLGLSAQKAPSNSGSAAQALSLSDTAAPGAELSTSSSNLLDALKSRGGSGNPWAALLADDTPETQPTPVLGGGYMGSLGAGIGSYYG